MNTLTLPFTPEELLGRAGNSEYNGLKRRKVKE